MSPLCAQVATTWTANVARDLDLLLQAVGDRWRTGFVRAVVRRRAEPAWAGP